MKRFDRFKHTNGASYAWIEVPISFLDTEAPLDAEWGSVEAEPAIFGEDGEELSPAVMRQKDMREFVLTIRYSLDDETCLVPLAAMERPTIRGRSVVESDLIEWEAFLSSHNIGVGKWLDIPQFKSLIGSPAYTEEMEA